MTPLIPDLEYKFDPNKREDYPEKQRTSSGLAQDRWLPHIRTWLRNPRHWPEGLNDKQYLTFKQYCRNFFLDKEGRLYRCSTEGDYQLVVDKEHRMYMMRSAHDLLGHRGFYATKSLLEQRFWWPELEWDVSWYVKSDRRLWSVFHPLSLKHLHYSRKYTVILWLWHRFLISAGI